MSADSRTAWATLQKNNAVATVDLGSAEITSVTPLGWKDHSVDGLDASDEDGAITSSRGPCAGCTCRMRWPLPSSTVDSCS